MTKPKSVAEDVTDLIAIALAKPGNNWREIVGIIQAVIDSATCCGCAGLRAALQTSNAQLKLVYQFGVSTKKLEAIGERELNQKKEGSMSEDTEQIAIKVAGEFRLFCAREGITLPHHAEVRLKSLWATSIRSALACERELNQKGGDARWDLLPSYLIDHFEGSEISEELLQVALAAMLADDIWLAKCRQVESKAIRPDAPERSSHSGSVEHGQRAYLCAQGIIFNWDRLTTGDVAKRIQDCVDAELALRQSAPPVEEWRDFLQWIENNYGDSDNGRDRDLCERARRVSAAPTRQKQFCCAVCKRGANEAGQLFRVSKKGDIKPVIWICQDHFNYEDWKFVEDNNERLQRRVERKT